MKKNIILSFVIALFSFYHPYILWAQKEDVPGKVDEYIDAYVQMNQFSGSVLIAQKDKIVVNKGYGYANIGFNIKNTPQTKFRIGSLTKGFTAVAIMQLVENDKLKLDDKLAKYIPDYPRGNEITLQHLLTHTSGIPNHTEFEDFDKERRVYGYSISETIETFKDKPLAFNPGEKFGYSNSNYILLGFIIEQASKISYEEYIRQNIFEPLQMENSGFERPDKIIKNMAQGYCFKNNEIENAKFRNMSNAHASGALYSTIEDLYSWDRALYSEKLISKESLKQMFTPNKSNYGFGWGIVPVFNHKMIAHSGDIDGYASNISRFTDDDICIIILSNFEHAPINRINKDLMAIVFGEQYKIPEVVHSVKLPEDILQAYAGKYELMPEFVLTISLSGGSLYCEPTNQPKFELLPVSENEFMLKEIDAKISFLRNTAQEIDRLILNQGGKQVSALRVGGL